MRPFLKTPDGITTAQTYDLTWCLKCENKSPNFSCYSRPTQDNVASESRAEVDVGPIENLIPTLSEDELTRIRWSRAPVIE